LTQGHFAAEFERRRDALRARMPDTAAAVDLFRRHFGPGVALTGAAEGAERYRDPEAFARAWAEAGSGESERLRALLTSAIRTALTTQTLTC
jgi:hypothetical protein